VVLEDLGGSSRPRWLCSDGAGFVWYGGLIGGLIAVSYLIRYHRLPWFTTTDCIAAVLPLGHAIGRIGCQLAGDGDWGRKRRSRGAWRTRTRSLVGTTHRVCAFIRPLCTSCTLPGYLRASVAAAVSTAHGGMVLSLYFILAGLARFFVEFVRIGRTSCGGSLRRSCSVLCSS